MEKLKQPNVVFIISDQWSTKIADGLSNNKNNIETPYLDKLAKEGIVFTNSYSSYPLCCPARASMFTGCMPHDNGVSHNQEIWQHVFGKFPKKDEIKTLGGTLQKAGYETAYFGKEHASEYGYDGIQNKGSMLYSAGGFISEGSVFDSIFTKDAINYLRSEHNKPFYMTLSLINPHDICKALLCEGGLSNKSIMDTIIFCEQEDKPYLRNSERGKLPDNFNATPIEGMAEYRDNIYSANDAFDENLWRRFISTYSILIEKTDWYIGLVLEELERQGLAEDTLVIFASDHGDMMGAHKLVAKTYMYEESVKTHAILRYPNLIKEGQINSHSMINTIDLMPTILDICNIEIPDTVKGKSFKPECLGETTSNFKETFSEN
ncbi:MAG: hypothetical protein ATN32_05495, partial [Candidatus Epulonipiscium fishelsonii]